MKLGEEGEYEALNVGLMAPAFTLALLTPYCNLLMFFFLVTDEQMQSGDSEVPQSNILCSGTNSYLITEVCGEGAFGKVVKAVNMATSQEVALKILKREDAAPREVCNLVHFEVFVSHCLTPNLFPRITVETMLCHLHLLYPVSSFLHRCGCLRQ